MFQIILGHLFVRLSDPYFESNLRTSRNSDDENCTMPPRRRHVFQTPLLDEYYGPTVVDNGAVMSSIRVETTEHNVGKREEGKQWL